MKKGKWFSAVWALLFIAFIAVGVYLWFTGGIPGLPSPDAREYVVCPEHLHLEDRQPGSSEIVTFYLVNLSKKEISVVGEKSSCSCALSENIPITVPPKETGEIKMRVGFYEGISSYDQKVSFMVATPKHLEMVPVRISASIAAPPTDGAEADTEPEPQDSAAEESAASDEPREEPNKSEAGE